MAFFARLLHSNPTGAIVWSRRERFRGEIRLGEDGIPTSSRGVTTDPVTSAAVTHHHWMADYTIQSTLTPFHHGSNSTTRASLTAATQRRCITTELSCNVPSQAPLPVRSKAVGTAAESMATPTKNSLASWVFRLLYW